MDQIFPVCVVGGGPAGLAAAISLSQAGHAVTVVDCAVPPVDKACGEGLMPDSLAALRQLGVSIPTGSGAAFQGIRFLDSNSCVTAGFPNGIGIGVRRTVLHDLLLRRAVELGITFLWGAKNVRLTSCGVWAGGELIRASFVVGADGQNSQIRRQAGLSAVRVEKRRYGFRKHYRIEPWSSYMELYWGPRCQLYVTPVSADEICVAVISRNSKLRVEDALSDFPDVQTRVQKTATVSTEMGALSVTRTLRRLYRDGIVLVGDASGSVDAITGEGMCLAFQQALALPQAMASGDFSTYERLHERASRRPRAMASLMLLLERHPFLQARVLAALAHRPGVFSSLVSIHVGASTFIDLFPRDVLEFGFALLAA